MYRKDIIMMIIKKREDAHHLVSRIKRMHEDIEEVEHMLNECMHDEDVDYRDDDYDDYDDDRRVHRDDRLRSTHYRRMRR